MGNCIATVDLFHLYFPCLVLRCFLRPVSIANTELQTSQVIHNHHRHTFAHVLTSNWSKLPLPEKTASCIQDKGIWHNCAYPCHMCFKMMLFQLKLFPHWHEIYLLCEQPDVCHNNICICLKIFPQVPQVERVIKFSKCKIRY